jgi:hypothetical protein
VVTTQAPPAPRNFLTPLHLTNYSKIPENITCQSVVGRYKGQFKNRNNPGDSINVDFQARVSLDQTRQQIVYGIEKWDNQTPLSSIQFYAWGKRVDF